MWKSVKFSGQQTYNGTKTVKVEAIEDGKDWGSSVLECRKKDVGRVAWELWLPARTNYGENCCTRLPGRALSNKYTLRDCKTLAERIILAAQTHERLEELRTVTEKPEWWTGRNK